MARPAVTTLTGNWQVVVPKPVRDALGLKLGDILEARAEGGAVVLRPKVLLDREEFLKQLKDDVESSKADVAAGRVLGPFDSAEQLGRALGIPRHRAKHARRRK
jgi:AbrB family looped-hinge helix DNA binding protein